MNRIIKKGLIGGVGLGAATAAMGYFLANDTELSEAEQISSIEACASHLGENVVRITGTLPQDCQSFSNAIGDFYLPVKSDFIAQQMDSVTTDEDLHDRAKKMGLVLGGLGLIGGAVVMGLSERHYSEEEKV